MTSVSYNLTHMRPYLNAIPHRDESGDKSRQRWRPLECLFRLQISAQSVLVWCLCCYVCICTLVFVWLRLVFWIHVCVWGKGEGSGLHMPHLDIKGPCWWFSFIIPAFWCSAASIWINKARVLLCCLGKVRWSRHVIWEVNRYISNLFR